MISRVIMAGLEPVVVVWKGLGIQVVVLLSFTVQAILVALADGRRYVNNRTLRIIIWSAYVLADTVAIYALGHMSLVSRLPKHHLMALWAPMLLVHLGGQDNITAYAIEDNRLWLRHLQNFGVQVLAAAYVLYLSTVLGSGTWLRSASILMFVVGVLKYGESVFALLCASNCASSSLSATSYEDFLSRHKRPGVNSSMHERAVDLDMGNLQLIAYRMLDVPKQMFEGPTRYVEISGAQQLKGEEMLKVVWIQLSMMYDLLYTKAAVVHTWYGWCIRLLALPATVVALVLFHLHASGDKGGGYSRVDVVATYVLLGGAVVLETISVVRAMGSSWTCALLVERGWVRLARTLRILERGWSYKLGGLGSVGQQNLFVLCAGSRKNISSKIARKMGWDDRWDSMFYSRSTRLTIGLTERVVLLVSQSERDQELEVSNSCGRNALQYHRGLLWSVELELDESILVWHIATHLYVTWLRRYRPILTARFDLDQVEVLSNYMFFLLAARPYMLPYPVTRQRYVQLCYDVISSPDDMLGSIQDQVSAWKRHSDQRLEIHCPSGGSLGAGCRLAEQLINRTGSMVHVSRIMCDVWVEMLCYTAYRCNENFHAKHLNDGGELLTAVALLMLYYSRGLIDKNDTGRAADTHTTDENNV